MTYVIMFFLALIVCGFLCDVLELDEDETLFSFICVIGSFVGLMLMFS